MSAAAAAQVEPEEDETEGGPAFEFDDAFQRKVLALLMREPNFALKARDLIKPGYFTEAANSVLAQISLTYIEQYRGAPGVSLFPALLKDAIAKKKIRSDMIDEVKDAFRAILKTDLSGPDYVLDKVIEFAKHQAIQNAMVDAIGALGKHDFSTIEKLLSSAFRVGAIVDRGEYDFWEESANRTQIREDFNAGKIVANGITTGLPSLDAYLHHNGWGRKELSLIMGAAKEGKSALLIQFGMAASLAGYNVIHFTLENSAQITADRIDANVTETAIRKLKDDPQTVQAKLDKARAKAGHFKIREYATGTLRPSEIRRVLEDYRQDGIIFDMIVVDYADIMMPERWTDSNVDNSKSIYVDLRSISFDYDAAVLTATQTNRDGAKAHTAKATDVAEDFNRIRIADIVLGINTTEQERIDGKARLHFVAARNSEDGFSLEVNQERDKMKFISKVIGRA
ncbi:DnaB-like helicase C-terminal domain-containing protein [Aureimonas sp. AU40]|uniref:DnaB-like helicase C-terminal domain-containing protein n=1 Tax=Aureimonas sp. AU40 TaxID=1637747 RepID=UPI000784A21B|nr:DnaB-like helicase C-terminal domain-containing protein [Aureimonas sp. AU40]